MEMDHISPLGTTNLSTGRYRLKKTGFLKTSSKHVALRNDALPRPRLVKDFTTLDQLSDVAAETTAGNEAISQNPFPLYRYSSGSTSSPSLLLGLGKYSSPSSQLRHQPSFPASKLTKQPLPPQLASYHGTSYIPHHNLPIIDPLSPIDLNKKIGFIETSPASKAPTLNQKGHLVANMDVSEGSLNYGKPSSGAAYGMSNNVSASAGNTQNPTSIYQHIHELSAKRVSTLDYLRKACVAFYYPLSFDTLSKLNSIIKADFLV